MACCIVGFFAESTATNTTFSVCYIAGTSSRSELGCSNTVVNSTVHHIVPTQWIWTQTAEMKPELSGSVTQRGSVGAEADPPSETYKRLDITFSQGGTMKANSECKYNPFVPCAAPYGHISCRFSHKMDLDKLCLPAVSSTTMSWNTLELQRMTIFFISLSVCVTPLSFICMINVKH